MVARLAEVELCKGDVCTTAHQLVRGDQISLVSSEQARKVGVHPLDDEAMPSDVVFPKDYVLIHDANGAVFDRCDVFVVRWIGGRKGVNGSSNVHPDDIQVARSYFGPNANLTMGDVEVPRGPWKRVAKIRFIRYRRYGFDRGFEHEYKPPVYLYVTTRPPLAWKLALLGGCIIDERGFVRP